MRLSKEKRVEIFHKHDYMCQRCGIRIPPEEGTKHNPDGKLWILEIRKTINDNNETIFQVVCNRCNCRENLAAKSPFFAGRKLEHKPFRTG